MKSQSFKSHFWACVCEVCQSFEKAPCLPAAGTSSASPICEKLQVDAPFVDDNIVLHAMGEYSPPALVCAKNPPKLRDALVGSRSYSMDSGGFLPKLLRWSRADSTDAPCVGRGASSPQTTQMDSGGEWRNGNRTDFRVERNFRLEFQWKGAHPRLSVRGNGLAGGICYRPAADGRSSGREILQSGFVGPRCRFIPDSLFTGQYLGPTRWTCFCGVTITATWSQRRIRQFRGNMPSSGHCVLWRRTRSRKRLGAANFGVRWFATSHLDVLMSRGRTRL